MSVSEKWCSVGDLHTMLTAFIRTTQSILLIADKGLMWTGLDIVPLDINNDKIK